MPGISDNAKTLTQFNRLIEEILRGGSGRSRFQPWEIDILLDIESCGLDGESAVDILPQYRNAVELEMSEGRRFPFKLSEYLETRRGIPYKPAVPDDHLDGG
jgi:hypothetical protein